LVYYEYQNRSLAFIVCASATERLHTSCTKNRAPWLSRLLHEGKRKEKLYLACWAKALHTARDKESSIMFQWLKELLAIYAWKEFWLVLSAPTMVIGVWLLFCLMLRIPNDGLRALSIWSLFFVLTLGATTVDALRSRRK
jgi:hypothetical protein